MFSRRLDCFHRPRRTRAPGATPSCPTPPRNPPPPPPPATAPPVQATGAGAGPRTGAGGLARRIARMPPELGVLMALTAALNLILLTQNAWANSYYSAAVRSMSSSWHNFLYDAFD